MAKSATKTLYWILGAGVCLTITIIALLDQPPVFSFNQAANHFFRKGDGLPQKFSSWLIRSGIAQDWSVAEQEEPLAAPYPLLQSAANARNTYTYQTYSSVGQPHRGKPGYFQSPPGTRTVHVATTAEISKAINSALPGDIITIAPGTYNFKTRAITVKSTGNAGQPIYVRAERFGTVLINLDTLEGFHVLAPFWIFENLQIRGTCNSDSACEHAFHVVGKGQSFTLRNSEVANFNAPVKVNLQPINGKHYYAGFGLLEPNSFYNESPRDTGNPVMLKNAA